MDVFRGQMTDPVLLKLRENSIFLIRGPPNMINLFQPLDLTVNGAAKAFLKRKCTEWYSGEISCLDPFAAIDPLEHGSTVPLIENGNLDQFDISSFVTYYSDEDDDDEWDIEGNPIRNIFAIIEDVV